MTKIKTSFESRAVASGGSWKSRDGVAFSGQKVLTIIPDGNVTVTTLTGYGPGGTDAGLIDFKAVRGLSELVSGSECMAGDNSWFENIELAGANAMLYVL